MNLLGYRFQKTNTGWNLRINVLDANKKKSVYVNGYKRDTSHKILEEMILDIEKGISYDNLKKYNRRYPDRE